MQNLSGRWNTVATWYIGIETCNRPWGISAAWRESWEQTFFLPICCKFTKERRERKTSWIFYGAAGNFWLPVCKWTSRYLILSLRVCRASFSSRSIFHVSQELNVTSHKLFWQNTFICIFTRWLLIHSMRSVRADASQIHSCCYYENT